MEIKKIMAIKSFLIGLILSKILTSICVALIAAHFDHDITFLQNFIVLLLSGTSDGFIIHLVLFCIYFFNIKLIVVKITSTPLFIIFLVLSGVLYFAIVTFIDWDISKRYFKDFESYISHGGYYSIYTMIVVFILMIMGIRSRNNLKKNMG
ncbi:MAG TPA: hypothetical protein VFF57_05585 [Hanamia sp.]|nr:hypothetical protein [Hanamia sp.]